MTTTVLFVHGTGVRRDDYHKTLVRVTAGLAHALPTAVVEPCLWGDDEGAKLARAGISIPDFSGQPPSADDASGHTALWQLLSADPSFELRELTGVAQPPGLRNSAALDALPAQVRGLGKHAPALAQLPDSGDAAARAATWAVACAAVAASDELKALLLASRIVDGRLRTALARACVARWQWQTAFTEGGSLSGATRDVLVALLTDALGGVDKSAALNWVKARFKGMALRWATDKARRERDVLFNAAYPAAGDILLYQRDGSGIRNFIESKLDACRGEVIVMAHSLGGIACVDLLVERAKPQVKALVTFGSQAPLLYELGALRSLAPGATLPASFPKRWLNFFDRDDLLSYLAAPIFKPVATDIEVRSGQPFPDAHSAYWNQAQVWERLQKELG